MSVTTFKKATKQCPNCQSPLAEEVANCVACGALIPVIRVFTSLQKIIRLDSPLTLEWEVEGAEKIEILPDIGEVAPSGRTYAYPTEAITYTLLATTSDQTVEAQVSCTLSAPAINYFTAADSKINLRYPTILHWEVDNAETIHIDRGVGEVSGRSFMEARLTEPGIYTLTAQNASGTVSATIELTLPKPEITLFSSGNKTVRPGLPSLLMWEVENAEKVYLEPEIGEVTDIIRQEVFPEQTMVYTLTAENHSGTISREVTLELPPPKILFFESSDQLSTEGKAVDFFWRVENAYKVEINQGIGEVTDLPKVKVKPSSAFAQYVLTATGHSGVKRRSLSLSVFPVPLQESLLIPIPDMNTDLELTNLELDTSPPELSFNPARMEDLEYIQEVDLPEEFFSMKRPSIRKEIKFLLKVLKQGLTKNSDTIQSSNHE